MSLERNLKVKEDDIDNVNIKCFHLQEQLDTSIRDLQSSINEKDLIVQRNIKLESDVNHLSLQLDESNRKTELLIVEISGKEQECAGLLTTIQTLESDKTNLQASIETQVLLRDEHIKFYFYVVYLICLIYSTLFIP